MQAAGARPRGHALACGAPTLTRVTWSHAPRPALAVLIAALVLAGCGGDARPRATPQDGVRAAVSAYLGALRARDWARACRSMTDRARRDLEDAAGAPCARALESGAALAGEELATAAREVAGADVRIRGATATLGPLGGLPEPLQLRRVGGRWLVAG
jgi:hypothetical protein